MGRTFLTIRILHEKCDRKIADDRTLPYNSYLVEYQTKSEINYDIVICNKKIEIFDYYWDRYREGLKSFKQTEGRINPKLWSDQKKTEKKRK